MPKCLLITGQIIEVSDEEMKSFLEENRELVITRIGKRKREVLTDSSN